MMLWFCVQCRRRWQNYLNATVKKGSWSLEVRHELFGNFSPLLCKESVCRSMAPIKYLIQMTSCLHFTVLVAILIFYGQPTQCAEITYASTPAELSVFPPTFRVLAGDEDDTAIWRFMFQWFFRFYLCVQRTNAEP